MSGPIIHRSFAQHSPEWFAMKAGKWSASNAAVIMGGLDTSGLASLIKDIAWERVYGSTESEGFKSAAMERGTVLEAEARDYYAFTTGQEVEQVGCVEHATVPNVCWSPDGIALRPVEIKAPLHKAWMDVKRTGKVPAEYRWQCGWACWVGEADGLDFVAYHPQAGGLLIPYDFDSALAEQMESRVADLEKKVAQWIDILTDQQKAA